MGLERERLVQRVFDAEDRRRVSVRLTPAGEAKLDEVMPDYYSRLRICMQGLDEADRTLLQHMLSQLHAGIGAFSD